MAVRELYNFEEILWRQRKKQVKCSQKNLAITLASLPYQRGHPLQVVIFDKGGTAVKVYSPTGNRFLERFFRMTQIA